MNKKMLSESHIDIKIMRILELCSSKQRSINNNLNKFKSIVEFEDREELTKELGKMLRASWSNEKKTVKINNDPSEKAVTVVNEDDDIDGIMLVESYDYERNDGSIDFNWYWLIFILLCIYYSSISREILPFYLIHERCGNLLHQIQLNLITIADTVNIVDFVDVFILLKFFVGGHLGLVEEEFLKIDDVVGFEHL